MLLIILEHKNDMIISVIKQCKKLFVASWDGGPLEKYCNSPGAQNDSFTKKVAVGIRGGWGESF